jgi:hypothetical protein
MSKQWLDNVPKYFDRYMELVTEDDLIQAMKNSIQELTEWSDTIDESKSNYAYEEGKWSVNDVLVHLIDTERIFQYRSLCIARGEKNNLPGYDHDEYTRAANTTSRSIASIVEEYKSVRQSSVHLFESFDEAGVRRTGNANGLDVQPILYGFLMSGHLRHHLGVLKSKY